jgi:hypothetical protein
MTKQARKPENRRKLEELRERYGKGRCAVVGVG